MGRGAARAALAFGLGALTCGGLQALLSASERQEAKLAPADVAPLKAPRNPDARPSSDASDPAVAMPEPSALQRAVPAARSQHRRSAAEHLTMSAERAQPGAAHEDGASADDQSAASETVAPPSEAQREVEAQAEFEAKAELESHAELELRSDALASSEDTHVEGAAPEPPAPEPILDPNYPLAGAALIALTQIYAEPAEEPNAVGYLRRGAHVHVAPGVPGPGCDAGWHAVQGGGYVCQGRSFGLLSERPELAPLPAAPNPTGPLPYAYVKISAQDLPLYAHTPTPDEEREVLSAISAAKLKGGANLQAIRALGLVDPRDPPPKAATPAGSKTAAAKRPPAGKPVAAIKASPASKTARGADKLTKNSSAPQVRAKVSPQTAKLLPPPPAARLLPEIVRVLLQPGYYVSLDPSAEPAKLAGADKSVVEASFLRTVRGDMMRSARETWVKPSVLHGELIEPTAQGQLALVYRPNQTGLQRDPANGALKRSDVLPMLRAVRLTDEAIRKAGREYRATADGTFVPVDALRFIPPPARPPFVPSSARYIAINLASQTLVAYDGDTPVYATLVSTGKTEHATPTGIFRIQHKHVSTTMNAEASGENDAYSIEDVPWTMYFSGSLALHAAFWHEGFGRPHSHGCVNLAPLDAKWLFDWAGPSLPPNFHGVVATRENPGTFVVISP